MEEEKKDIKKVQQTIENPVDPTLVMKFYKPYNFEGEKYTELDLSGLKSINGGTLIDMEKFYGRDGAITTIPEMSFESACFIASRVTGKPIEFFYQMPAHEAIKLRNRVRAFLRDAG